VGSWRAWKAHFVRKRSRKQYLGVILRGAMPRWYVLPFLSKVIGGSERGYFEDDEGLPWR
jgi:hypothetical protein